MGILYDDIQLYHHHAHYAQKGMVQAANISVRAMSTSSITSPSLLTATLFGNRIPPSAGSPCYIESLDMLCGAANQNPPSTCGNHRPASFLPW